ncbi:RRM domain-containing protein [Citrus sinensis]|uniref:RRM domain-containing protein n=1 Tax=Citrus sinensis TaxID=2711 RepID=A0ACB8K5J2_CITSI|nr:RRM domain-containing protein [Citrus sinensis]
MSSSSQPQFRYTQTPSKVLHLRNLPWECIEEELVELCKPFGKIVNTKCNVGANRNQAFVEFADLNQAISMVSYYASSSEPAQVRGKTVYIQYSNRHEIVNNKSPGDVPGNVLLVTIEGVEAGDVSIDVIHLVFSAFGFVHKIATFEKAAGFQALIQFTDAETASSARNALDGRKHVGSCHLRISYSAHTDLNIKFQSHRSRDYTNPYLPVNPTAIEGVMQVFSAFGTVQKVAIFEKNGGTQALIQYPDITTAAVAKESLEGHCIYDGGYCKLHLSYSRHTDLNVKAYSDKSRDYTVQDQTLLATQQIPSVPAAPSVWQSHQAAPMYSGSEYATAVPGQVPPGQVPSWNPSAQAGPAAYVSASGPFPGQTYPQSPVFAYATAPTPTGSSPLSLTQPGVPPVRPGGASPPGHPPYYVR